MPSIGEEACCREEPEFGSAAWLREEENMGRLLNAALFTLNSLRDVEPQREASALGDLRGALPQGAVREGLEEWSRLLPPRSREPRSAEGSRRFELRMLEALLARLPSQHSSYTELSDRFHGLARRSWAGLHSRSRSSWATEMRRARRETPDLSREPVHVAMVASVGRPAFGRKALIGIRSALFFARSKPVRFHLIVDEEGEEDMQKAIDTLEPWLRHRGQFRLYRAEKLHRVWQFVHDMFPADCLNYRAREGSHHYGSPGFLRLFPHQIIKDPTVKVVIWVDAGDFAFLQDPAELLRDRRKFSQEHALATPLRRELPFQLMDLPRMRRANWTRRVAEVAAEGYVDRGPDLCLYGEGRLFNLLATGRHSSLWYHLRSSWTYEPWQEWQPFFGLLDLWTKKGGGLEDVWLQRAFPGLRDFTQIRVDCPDWQEVFFFNAWFAKASDAGLEASALLAKGYHEMRVANASFKDWKAQELQCGQRIDGVHLTLPFHNIPWAHRFLNFWAGAPVWNKDWLRGRDLRK